MSDGENRKLSDLRVVDLRIELGKRGLDKVGIKQVLTERLEKALKDENLDPETYVFTKMPAKPPSITVPDEGDGSSECLIVDEIDDDIEEISIIENTSLEESENIKTVEKEEPKTNEEFSKCQPEEIDSNDRSDLNDSDTLIQITLEEEDFQDDDIVGSFKTNDDELKPKDIKNTSSKNNQHVAKEIADNSEKIEGKKEDEYTATERTSNSSSKTRRSYHNRNLWITNIPQNTRAAELKHALSPHGKVIGAKVVINAKHPGASCYGYVTMNTIEDAENCIKHLNNTELNGHLIRIEKLRPDHMNEFKGKCSDESKDKDKQVLSKSKENLEKKGDKAKDDKKEGKDTSDAKRNDSKRKSRSRGRSLVGQRKSYSRSSRSNHNRDILTFDKIKEERERQKYREQERIIREDSRRRREEAARQRDIEQMQRSEAARLNREREKLRVEREQLERDKAEVIRLERERQRMERERLELEKLEIQRVKQSLQEQDRRSLKRPSSYKREGSYEDRKRPNSDRRYEEPSQIRFDAPRDIKKSQDVTKKFGTSKEYKTRVVFNKREPEFQERSHAESSMASRAVPPAPVISKYNEGAIFNSNHQRNVRGTSSTTNIRMSKDFRYNERDRERSPQFRSIRDERDRRTEHKADIRSSRDHRYTHPVKETHRYERNSGGGGGGGTEGWSHNPKFGQSGSSEVSSKSWAKETWRPVQASSNSNRWNSSSMTRGGPMSAGTFQGNNINLGPSCPPAPPISSYRGDAFEYKAISNLRKY
ncbi:hypothetical protein FQA39_LY15017 [Lamprigera yunnana]|nr:hypothetical protein FQA39_LY15017 [Lamprigera yunnana]